MAVRFPLAQRLLLAPSLSASAFWWVPPLAQGKGLLSPGIRPLGIAREINALRGVVPAV